jgi:protein-disulfide isomerase
MELVLQRISPSRSTALSAAALLAALATAGCHAQVPPAGSGAEPVKVGVKLSPQMARRVEILLRTRSTLPLDTVVAVGTPEASEIAGFDRVGITFTTNGKTSNALPFLISTDGKTLAQFNKFDMSVDPKQRASAEGRPARGGGPNAPVLIVGFDDLECPFCARMHAEIFPAILDRYKDQVRIVYRDFPLEEIHPWAMHAAIDANCLGAGSTTGYWNYVDYVHAHAAEMGGAEKSAAKAAATLDSLALEEGARQKLDAAALSSCLQKQDTTTIKASIKDGEADPLRVDATPAMFINGEKVDGVVTLETLYKVIDNALTAAGQTPPPPVQVLPAPVTPAQPAPPATKPGS